MIQEFNIVDPYLAARVLHHLAKGVAASHHVGVVHRDLKPSNVMVIGGFNLPQLKITDFGIAKMTEEELAEAVAGGNDTMTSSQTMVGALPYMAPEMIENPRDASTPADIWALGAMIYELLSGKKPFGVGLAAVPKILSAKTPHKPKYIDSNVQFKPLGNELLAVVNSCLRKEPIERPCADDLVKECEQLCYPTPEREVGVVDEIRYSSWGFITAESGTNVFFHLDSVFGKRPGVGSKVCFSKFPGVPQYRAHPVLLLRN